MLLKMPLNKDKKAINCVLQEDTSRYMLQLELLLCKYHAL